MIDLQKFREVNKLKQKYVAAFLKVSAQFVSQVENGKRKLPLNLLSKLLNNDKGWDTCMLVENNGVIQKIGDCSNNNTYVAGMAEAELAKLKQKIELLEKLLEEKERTIQILMNK